MFVSIYIKFPTPNISEKYDIAQLRLFFFRRYDITTHRSHEFRF